MAFEKSHPMHSWAMEKALATADKDCAAAQLASVERQVEGATVEINAAEEVIRALESSPDRRIRAEVSERKRHLSHLTRLRENILKAQRVVEARLKRFEERLTEFPQAELDKEIALQNAKHRAGSVPRSGSIPMGTEQMI
jgi:hypothetical protein